MPDLAAGTTVTGEDTPPLAQDDQPGSYTFTNTSFGVAIAGGTYADCGDTFIAPTTGRVKVHIGGNTVNSGASSTLIGFVVRAGGVVGSGAVHAAATNAASVGNQGSSAVKAGRTFPVLGLTPGATYNVRLEHRVTAGTGTGTERNVLVDAAS